MIRCCVRDPRPPTAGFLPKGARRWTGTRSTTSELDAGFIPLAADLFFSGGRAVLPGDI